MVVLTIVATGGLFAWWMAAETDRGMREGLLGQTRLVAQAVNIDRLKALTGTEADLTSPEYLRLKEQLGAVRSANPHYRIVYLMGRKADGAVFFYANNEPVGSENEAPAGHVFEQISPDYLRAFNEKMALTVGPVTDRWGT